jgi:hypothetical protein
VNLCIFELADSIRETIRNGVKVGLTDAKADSPELNPVEQLWQQIKQRFLSNTTFQHYDDIIERSC